MPCFDKKLEASRDDFRSSQNFAEVDTVLSSNEVVEMLLEQKVDFASLAESDVHSKLQLILKLVILILFRYASMGPDSDAMGSDGYCDAVLKYAAKMMYQIPLEGNEIQYKTVRNVDFKEASVEVCTFLA